MGDLVVAIIARHWRKKTQNQQPLRLTSMAFGMEFSFNLGINHWCFIKIFDRFTPHGSAWTFSALKNLAE